MALLKTTILAILLLAIMPVYAQDSELQNAFKESLRLEEAEKFEDATKVLMAQYLPLHYEINLRLGWLYYRDSNFVASNKYYNKAVEIMPYAIEPKIAATLPKAKLNKWDEIEKLYLDVLKISPKNNIALYNLGLLFYNRANYVAAYDKFEELSNLYPADYDASILFAWTSLKMGKSREAKVLFNKILLFYPTNESAIIGLKACK